MLSEEEKTRFQQDLNTLMQTYGFDSGYVVAFAETTGFAAVIVTKPIHPELEDHALLTLDLIRSGGAKPAPRANDN